MMSNAVIDNFNKINFKTLNNEPLSSTPIVTTTSTVNNSSDITVIDFNYKKTIIKSLNNFPLNHNLTNSDFNIGTPVYPSTPTPITVPTPVVCEPCKPENTYELFYKNLKSYPSVIDTSNPNYFIKVFTLPDNKSITLTTDMSDPNLIISTFSGDIPPEIPKIKKTHITPTNITVEYV